MQEKAEESSRRATVLVVGGDGFVGRRTCRALRVADIETVSGSRNPQTRDREPDEGRSVRVDLCDPATFPVLQDFDLVINCADSLTAPPDEAVAHCLGIGVPWIEASAEPETVTRLLVRFRHASRGDSKAATPVRAPLILGAGIFPGLSNLMAAFLVDEAPERASGKPPVERLETAVRYMPLGGAGGGVTALMGAALTQPRYWIEAGQKKQGPPIGPAVSLPFLDGRKKAWQVGLPDVLLLQETTRVPAIGSYVGPATPFLPPGIPTLSRLFDGALARPIDRLASLGFRLLRGRLFANRVEPIELLAVADRDTQRERRVIVTVDDGMLAAGATLAVSALELLAQPPQPGLHVIDEVSKLGPFLGRLQWLGKELEFAVGSFD